jgi:mRNA interferase HigB
MANLISSRIPPSQHALPFSPPLFQTSPSGLQSVWSRNIADNADIGPLKVSLSSCRLPARLSIDGNQFGYFFVNCTMNVYNRSSLTAFYGRHPDCKETLEKWYHDVGSMKWKKPGDVTRDFNTARTIKNNRAIFKINHNDYRLIAEINYEKGWLFIKFIGTHPQYDQVDAATIDLFGTKKKKK